MASGMVMPQLLPLRAGGPQRYVAAPRQRLGFACASPVMAHSVFCAYNGSRGVRRTGEACSRSRGAVVAPLRALGTAARVADVAAGLEGQVQLVYLGALLSLLAGGSYLVVRQVLVRQQLEEAAKDLGERVRSGSASAQDYYEMGCVMLRKKVYTQAIKNLQSALDIWDGEQDELAQLHNAMGFAYWSQGKPQLAAENYERAVAMVPSYATAWKNLGDVRESEKQFREALDAYERAQSFAPDDKTAQDRITYLKMRVSRLGM